MRIIEKAMAKNLKMRYQNTSILLRDIELLEALLEKGDANENEERDPLETPSSSDFSSPIAKRHMFENKSRSQEGESKSQALNFGAQLFLGILLISGIIAFMYLINNRF